MGTCPFCKESVDDAILEYGGRCPSCLIEIPGEDAPTDPGEAAQAVMQAQEAAAAEKSRRPFFAILGVAALAVAGVGFMALTPQDSPDLAKVETGAEAYKSVSSSFLSIDLDDEDDGGAAPMDGAMAEASPKPTPKKPSARSNSFASECGIHSTSTPCLRP